MNKKNIFLKIDEKKHLEICNLDYQKNHVCKYDAVGIYFINHDTKYKLYHDVILCDFDVFKNLLFNALENKLQLVDSIKKYIGLLWNQELQKEDHSHDLEINLTNYLLWSSGPQIKYSTWLYNKGDEIFLEISPDYPWHFVDPKDREEWISYASWEKNYKPLFFYKLDKKIVQNWIYQLDEIIFAMKENDLNHK